MNKIFILPNHEIKARLSEFIHPDDIPKKYGGNLDWEFGTQPNLDLAAREALEKNGTNGWIPGPCLWEQNQRVPVGTLSGKSRRPAKLPSIPVPEPTLASAAVKVAQPLPTTQPALSTVAPAIIQPQAQPESAETSSPPSRTYSGSTASTFVSPSPKTTGVLPANGTINAFDSESPIVANGEVIHVGNVKPPMERFVTAAEDFHTVRPQVNGVA